MVDVDKFNLLLNVVEPIVKEKIHSFEDSFRNRNEETSLRVRFLSTTLRYKKALQFLPSLRVLTIERTE